MGTGGITELPTCESVVGRSVSSSVWGTADITGTTGVDRSGGVDGHVNERGEEGGEGDDAWSTGPGMFVPRRAFKAWVTVHDQYT